MEIVVLTNKNSIFGKKLINELIQKNIQIQTIVVIKQPLRYYIKLFKYVKKRIGLFDAIYFSLYRIFFNDTKLQNWNSNKFIDRYEDMGMRIIFTPGTNSEQTVACLKKLKPDLLILGQTGIIQNCIIRIPKIGILNAHPGILPYYRGIDCGKWALYNDDYNNIGCTVHWVDEGVDTGGIILREKYNIADDESLKTFEKHLDNFAICKMVDVVKMMIQNKKLKITYQQKTEGKQYYKMPRKVEHTVKRLLAARDIK